MATSIIGSKLDWRAEIHQFLESELSTLDEAHAPQMTERVIDAYRANPAFIDAVLCDALQPIVHREILAYFARTRHDAITTPDGATTRAKLASKAKAIVSRWEGWWEHAGDRHIRLMDMTRDDLLMAANQRQAIATTNQRIGALWARLADELGDGERVRDRYSAQQIEKLSVETGVRDGDL